MDNSMNNELGKADILSSKLQLIVDNKVPEKFTTHFNKTFEWIWLTNSVAEDLIAIRNAEHVLSNMRNSSPITMEEHLKFLKTYVSLQRIDFVLIDKDTDLYVGGVNICLTDNGFEMGKYIGNLNYIGKGIAYPMTRNFIRYVNDNLNEINNIRAVTRLDNARNINLNFKLGFKIIKRVEKDYWLMGIE
jgi:RimJ/RimL family protein N-acetyltransferase